MKEHRGEEPHRQRPALGALACAPPLGDAGVSGAGHRIYLPAEVPRLTGLASWPAPRPAARGGALM
ncbi:MAG: hypothetical protein F4X22_06040 [Gemmatimonadales bacterium]|nr:hypothetical protein [Candidatus Palauibacter denitrificans]